MKRYRKQCLFDLISGFVCGVAVVVFACLVLHFIRNADPAILGLVVLP